MKHDSIGLVMAMREEIRPFVQRLGRHRNERAGRFPVYLFRLDGRQITLIESGMGKEKATAATKELITYAKPRILISAGFGGAVRGGLAVSDVVVAGQALAFKEEGIAFAGRLMNEPLLRDLENSFSGRSFLIADGTTVTTSSILPKEKARQLIPEENANPVLDMETSAVAETAAANGIPLVALRAISDAAEEELLFSLDEITDREMNIRVCKVLATIAKNPRVLPQMLRLARNAKLAGNSLAIVLERVVRMV
jgi:adenosylhomocysteine nucleosidase